MRRMGGAVARALIYVIQLYRHMVSPLRPASCRFMPTCSQYAVDALTEYGVVRGAWLSVARLAKCGPWHRGGWDPIPERPDVTDDPDGPAGDPPIDLGDAPCAADPVRSNSRV
ncbi:membrane protein insertion efficiency factor YidD [Mycobacterium sp. PS03_16]|uniref:membrane protein insertion efficiency factor YidD n=1 Tax=Mycobacterium sp. PS03-16 TaxID=2559611 RepID=UPI001ADDDA01